MALAKRIKVRRAYLHQLRRSKTVSGQEVADAIGMSSSKYYRIERGEYDFSSDAEQKKYLERLADLYIISYDWLHEREQEYLSRKIEYMSENCKNIYTLHSRFIRKFRQDFPNASRIECATALGLSANTVSKYWKQDKEEINDEKTDNSRKAESCENG